VEIIALLASGGKAVLERDDITCFSRHENRQLGIGGAIALCVHHVGTSMRSAHCSTCQSPLPAYLRVDVSRIYSVAERPNNLDHFYQHAFAQRFAWWQTGTD
jgi:hypothetical protein